MFNNQAARDILQWFHSQKLVESGELVPPRPSPGDRGNIVQIFNGGWASRENIFRMLWTNFVDLNSNYTLWTNNCRTLTLVECYIQPSRACYSVHARHWIGHLNSAHVFGIGRRNWHGLIAHDKSHGNMARTLWLDRAIDSHCYTVRARRWDQGCVIFNVWGLFCFRD